MIILIGLFICHFLADYTPLSTKWMLSAKIFGNPLFPILTHAFVHSFLMGVFMLYVSDNYTLIIQLAIFQLLSHFIIDVCKGRMNFYFPKLQDNSNSWHWIVFGLDQLLHAIVIIIMFSKL